MIRLFLRQHLKWLIFMVFMQAVCNMLLYLDVGFNQVSYMYINSVWLLLMCVFVIAAYAMDRRKLLKYEQPAKNYMETVEQMYSEQLAQLDHELKEQRLKLLEKQDEQIAWVHEMKAPMTVLQLLHDKVTDYTLKEQLEAEWLRLYLLLDQQLHATRLLTIGQDSKMEQVKLRDVVLSEIKAVRSWCFERQIAIEMEAVDEIVTTDKKWISFIVRQALTNAIKYSHVGGTITISSTNTEFIQLHIVDEGIGIAPEDLPRVFKKSYTGTAGRETSTASGMGLYLAKVAAESTNVELTLQSSKQTGTMFTITFPKMNAHQKTLGM